MAQWGTKSRMGKAPSKGQKQQPASKGWQESRPGRAKVSREAVATRAYEKWIARGRSHGDDQKDWLEAERELSAEANKN